MKWKKYEGKSIQDYEKWLGEMDYEPYVHDPVLQSIDWIKDITEAIKKVSNYVGEYAEIEYLYWEKLSNWESMLNYLSIARAFGGIAVANKKLGWKTAFEQLRFWVDAIISHEQTRDLYYNGASYFYEMPKLFTENRKFCNPKTLAKEVLAYEIKKIIN